MVATIAAVAALAAAGTGAYGAVQAGKAQGAANSNARWAQEQNYQINKQNQEMDLINSVLNARQRELDNQRYDEAVGREDKQRQFTNKLATATTVDADGNRLQFDPLTGAWTTAYSDVGRDNVARRRTNQNAQNTAAVIGGSLGAMRGQAQASDAAHGASQARALSDALMARYAATQGRTPQQMEAAGIERNVASATDPLITGGNMAMLQGYRQGNSGSDALMGSLARQSQGGTRAAIANARYSAPSDSAGEHDALSKALLAPATTLAERGNTPLGTAAPTFDPDRSGALMASINRGNAAGVGSQLNPRSGNMLGVAQRGGTNAAFQPLNATGNTAAGVSASLSSLSENKALMSLLDKWGSGKTNNGNGMIGDVRYAPDAPVNATINSYQAGDYPSY